MALLNNRIATVKLGFPPRPPISYTFFSHTKGDFKIRWRFSFLKGNWYTRKADLVKTIPPLLPDSRHKVKRLAKRLIRKVYIRSKHELPKQSHLPWIVPPRLNPHVFFQYGLQQLKIPASVPSNPIVNTTRVLYFNSRSLNKEKAQLIKASSYTNADLRFISELKTTKELPCFHSYSYVFSLPMDGQGGSCLLFKKPILLIDQDDSIDDCSIATVQMNSGPLLAAALYLSTGQSQQLRLKTIAKLQMVMDKIFSLASNYENLPINIAGDFNCSEQELLNFIEANNHLMTHYKLTIVSNYASELSGLNTRKGTGTRCNDKPITSEVQSRIDYILTNCASTWKTQLIPKFQII